MKYIKSIPQENEEVTKELTQNQWKLLKEPSSLGVTIAVSMPISIILMFITIFYFRLLFPESMNFLNTDRFRITFSINLKCIFYVAGILLYTFLHEMIHALTIPNVIRSNKTFWGINGCFGFVYSEEKIKKGRFILVSIMPLLVLTFVVALVCRVFHFYHWYLLLLCVINAGGACVDIFNVILIAKQVPAKGMIVNNGMRTLFK